MSTKLLAIVRDQIQGLEAERDTLVKERDVRQNEADALVENAESEKRDLDNKEAARFREVNAQIREIDGKLDNDVDGDERGITQRLADLTERKAELDEHVEAREKAQKAADEWGSRVDDGGQPTRNARVGNEPRTYTRESERQGVSFYRDLTRKFRDGDTHAAERIERHQREARLNELAGYETRDVGTGNFAGLTVPQYLTDLAAPLARAMRPTVDIVNRHPLPADGMTIHLSRLTTGTDVGAQSAEGDASTEQDADDTELNIPVRTYTGQQDVSRQALDRSTGVDELLTQDLVSAYWTTLDDAILNAAGTNGTHLGIRNTGSIETVAYADTSPTVAELYPKLAQLISQIQSGVFMGVTHFIMHPRRWWWIASQVTTNQPFLTVPGAGANQAGQVGGTEYMAQNRSILGVPVVVDGNIPTNLGGGSEDVILGVTDRELHLWHDEGPLFIRAEQPGAGNLEVKLVVFSYSAWSAGRYPGAHGTISSTGLTTPSFG